MRVSLVQSLLTTKELPTSVGAKLLDINRTSIYYKDNPTWGARQMSAQLKSRGYHVGRRKARRYMNEMDIYSIYSKMNLSKQMQQAKVCPCLLRNAVIDAPNKAFKVAKPRILNSDQGCQFTSQQYIDFVKQNGIRQGMDGKSR